MQFNESIFYLFANFEKHFAKVKGFFFQRNLCSLIWTLNVVYFIKKVLHNLDNFEMKINKIGTLQKCNQGHIWEKLWKLNDKKVGRDANS